jgi:lysozyme family protein
VTRTFADVLAFVLAREGGFVNDPRDPGGMTNLGVTARQWQAWTGHGVNEAVMRSLTPAAVGNFYRSGYWHAIAGEQLPIALALAVFDFAVNAGPSRAVFECRSWSARMRTARRGLPRCARCRPMPPGSGLPG